MRVILFSLFLLTSAAANGQQMRTVCQAGGVKFVFLEYPYLQLPANLPPLNEAQPERRVVVWNTHKLIDSHCSDSLTWFLVRDYEHGDQDLHVYRNDAGTWRHFVHHDSYKPASIDWYCGGGFASIRVLDRDYVEINRATDCYWQMKRYRMDFNTRKLVLIR